jgi:hypothetical protein
LPDLLQRNILADLSFFLLAASTNLATQLAEAWKLLGTGWQWTMAPFI